MGLGWEIGSPGVLLSVQTVHDVRKMRNGGYDQDVPPTNAPAKGLTFLVDRI